MGSEVNGSRLTACDVHLGHQLGVAERCAPARIRADAGLVEQISQRFADGTCKDDAGPCADMTDSIRQCMWRHSCSCDMVLIERAAARVHATCTCDSSAASGTRVTARDRVVNEQLARVFSCALLTESDDASRLLKRYSWSDLSTGLCPPHQLASASTCMLTWNPFMLRVVFIGDIFWACSGRGHIELEQTKHT